MQLSIIIPVYNVEKYIKKCILSVVNNNLHIKEYEIIVIDDESPDNSVDIISKMMDSNPQIKLFRQKNKGLGGARNTGVDNALGKFILFLDSDDFLKKNVLRGIVEKGFKESLDILEFGAIGVLEDGKEIYRNSKCLDEVLTGFEYLEKIDYMHSACNKLYSRSFLNKYRLRFKEHIFIEDFEFNTRAFYYAKRVKATNTVMGCFVQTSNSITRNTSSINNLKKVQDIEEVIDLIISFKNKVQCSNLIYNMVFNERIAFLTVTLFYNLMKSSIDKNQIKLIVFNLRNKGLYPVKTSVKNKIKNWYRLIINNEFVFSQLCNLNKLIR